MQGSKPTLNKSTPTLSDDSPDDRQTGRHDKDVGGALQSIHHLLHPLEHQAAHIKRRLRPFQQCHQQTQDPSQVLACCLAHGRQGDSVRSQQAAAGDEVSMAAAVAVQGVQNGILDAGVAFSYPGVSGIQTLTQKIKDARGQGPHLSEHQESVRLCCTVFSKVSHSF